MCFKDDLDLELTCWEIYHTCDDATLRKLGDDRRKVQAEKDKTRKEYIKNRLAVDARLASLRQAR